MLSRVELGFLATALIAHAGALYGATLFPSENLLTLRKGTAQTPLEFEFEPRTREQEVLSEDFVTDAQQAAARVNAPYNPDEPARARRNGGLRGRGAAGTNGVPTEYGTEGLGDGGGEDPDPGSDPNPNDWSEPDPEGIPGIDRPIWEDPTLLAVDSRGAPAETKLPKGKRVDSKSVNNSLAAEIRKNDKKLGLGLPAAGTVASIFKAAVEGSDAPGNATASYTVALGPGGKVKSIKFNSASAGNQSTWEGIARTVKGALASQKLNLSGDWSRGAVIAIAVTSKIKMPSGSEVGAGLEFSLEQKFDVADIGARPTRVVSVVPDASPVN